MQVKHNLEGIREKVKLACEKADRSVEDITIIAVTKYVTIERAKEALEAGVTNLGENREEGLLAKREVLMDEPVWHFIGSLQTRKVKSIINHVDYIHSLDRLSLAKEINKRAEKKIKCFVQVNVSQEESKHGIAAEDTIDFIKSLEVLPNIEIVGLMTMAPFTDEEELLRNCFRNLKKLQTEVQKLALSNAPCQELSMGMSNDYSIAIEEGATMIRIGTALVGSEK
ncbi:YggS family pyridoxal phosphate-dependent enzyme [Niallia taxi]|uniref:YggS family pyridoxal phosphate-dependent enzyme n=1 Tax=Niallia taxi TaxID=2499688 RepID=UPI0011A36402|nr:YggS family pyridoxal phosphate-dependent enzyme [Niallia taxi]MCT2344208.1 YggS family pyridoxal phosphate-dependent enzyme [Niallia taxi]MDE5051415.1 YggS family pyridoxal phosphate-dependent enzyme [Niallia taxi]MED3964679.1 YggS family pyridoxal phosphate-dependent enzyme [Niallia taxi]WOD62149.1 YggS family pyridoxal phosphate-dependent enzyme [Niallia taxi]